MSKKVVVRLVAAVMFVLGALASALAQMPNPYGTAISLENAKKAAAPALAEAAKIIGEWQWRSSVQRARSFTTRKWTTRSLAARKWPLIRRARRRFSSDRRKHFRMLWGREEKVCGFSR